MLGTFFFAFARKLTTDLHNAGGRSALRLPSQDTAFRYGYLLWLVAYFFVAALSNKLTNEAPDAAGTAIVNPTRPSGRDIAFDVIQSIASFIAACYLGFIDPTFLRQAWPDYLVTNIAIAAIFLSAWLLFHKISPDVNVLRATGLTVALITSVMLLAIHYCHCRTSYHLVLMVTQPVLWLVLVCFFVVRMDKGPTSG